MEQENARSLKEIQQGEGEVREDELKGVVGGMDDMSIEAPTLSLSPIPTFAIDDPEINFDMEKPSKNLF